MARRTVLVLFLACAVGLVGVSAAVAAPVVRIVAHSPGAQTLSLRRGHGLAIVSIRGSTLGRLAAGRIRIYKPSWSTARIFVYGSSWHTRRPGGWRVWVGTGMTYRIYGGTWRARIRAWGISLSAAGRGWFALEGNRGTYSKAGAPYRRWPTSLRYFRLGT